MKEGVFSIPKEYNLTSSPLADSWFGGLYSGNGDIGVMLTADRERGLLRLRLGNVRYIDKRPEEMRTGRVSYDSSRLEIGSLYLVAPNIEKDSSLELDLMEGVIKGTISGTSFELFTAREPSLIVVKTTLPIASFEPAEAITPRYFVSHDMPKGYPRNPEPISGEDFCRQDLLNGKSFFTRWKKEKDTLFIACDFGEEPQKILEEAELAKVDLWRSEVKNSYQEFYRKSFLSIPDQELERFYFVNLYKWNSATRKENDFVLDLMGPWPKESGWCAVWWNLNIQLTYTWLQTAGRSEEMRPFIKMLSNNLSQLRKNSTQKDGYAIGRASSYDCRSPVKTEKGLLPWVCHILAKTYFYTGDKEILTLAKELIAGVLKEYEALLYPGEDGFIHMKPTLVPEYGETGDSNFDLALLKKMIGYFQEFFAGEKAKEGDLEKYQFILENLAEYSRDEVTGYRMGKDLPLTESHPHPSHLFMAYPLELPHNKELAIKGADHFLAMDEKHHGFSYTNTAGLFVRYGNGRRARDLLHTLLRWMRERNTTNYLYQEYGNPVIETPYGFNSILQDMLLLSSKEKIRLFPAIPPEWEKASFTNFHCEGDISVSASFDKKEGIIRGRFLTPEGKTVTVLLPDGTRNMITLEAGKALELEFTL